MPTSNGRSEETSPADERRPEPVWRLHFSCMMSNAVVTVRMRMDMPAIESARGNARRLGPDVSEKVCD